MARTTAYPFLVLNLSSRMGSSGSLSVSTTNPARSFRKRLAGIGADAVAVPGQLGEALSGIVGRHRSVRSARFKLAPFRFVLAMLAKTKLAPVKSASFKFASPNTARGLSCAFRCEPLPEAHFTNPTPGGDQVPSSTSPLGQ